MNKTRIFLGLLLLLLIMDVCKAEKTGDVWRRDTLTSGFWGLNENLENEGIEMDFGVTNIYQSNAKGGLSTHNKRGRYSGSYDLEMSTDLQKLLGWDSGTIFLHLEGGWPDQEGIDGLSVGSAFGVNADAGGNDNILVKQLYYEGPIFSDRLTMMIGKIDFTGVFDTSAYADDECSQFINAAFVDNPTIPFPAYSLGATLNWDITDSWYLLGGIADAQADSRETGFRTTFHDEDYFFYALETGITTQLKSANGPMPGAYRVGLWNDPQPKSNSDGTKNYRDDIGVYTSCDQMLCKENSDPEDSQGLGAFFRYGYAPGKKNDITNFFSFGFHYQGLLHGRDDDVLGLAFAQGIFSNSADTTYTDDHENAVELYYNAQVATWLNISPSVQYITNPGGNKTANDAVVMGVRAQMAF